MTLVAAECKPAILAALERADAGELLSAAEAYAFEHTSSSELLALLQVADALRVRHHGQTITYSRKVFLPLTNLCRDYCGYCTFRKDPGEPGAKTMTPDEVLEVASAGARLGCKEALFSLGDKPEALFPAMRQELQRYGHRRTLDYLVQMCQLVLEHTPLLPHANPGVMGPKDLARLRDVSPSMGIMLETTSRRLLGKGMAHDNAPDKDPVVRLKTIENAGKLHIPFTTGILMGIGETFQERVDALCAIRDLHERYGHIQEVIIQNFRAKPGIPMQEHPEPTLRDFLRTIAVARLLFGGAMNLQVPPNLTPEQYQLLLMSGINDWGGVSPLTIDFINPEAPWPQLRTLAQVSAEMGLCLRQRLTVYPEYIVHKEGFMAPALAPRIQAMVAADGYPLDDEKGAVRP
ncbi:MAG: 7,8-didemethyl-8-hydroxy-5-deazariboflavin synthase subunit CofG [Candidatus Tectomicrobia bacterium]|uniref:7,8-didemethyl-8-hydroxy-5-deazariboflavin synthase n=1 Tax=Tectimicrobiota bacterium TaxID=2528274 RepID=A0A937VZD1_UNCTE|nr:7,8-didemethyl-8-hydroxy-5-deazariboflavin synthase subunit CofG [Candidatus Tectomicrobia bacterium]